MDCRKITFKLNTPNRKLLNMQSNVHVSSNVHALHVRGNVVNTNGTEEIIIHMRRHKNLVAVSIRAQELDHT